MRVINRVFIRSGTIPIPIADFRSLAPIPSLLQVLYVGIENGMYDSVAFVEESIDRIAPEKRGANSVETENVEVRVG